MSISLGNKKLGKIPNISLPPGYSCGNCLICFQHCYARKAYRLHPSTKKSWDENWELLQKNIAGYYCNIIDFLDSKKPEFFRWHVSGDIIHQEYVDLMCMVARRFPKTNFLCYTRRFDLNYKYVPDNLNILFSIWPGDHVSNKKPLGVAGYYWIRDGVNYRIPVNAYHCKGSCIDCKYCFLPHNQFINVTINKH